MPSRSPSRERYRSRDRSLTRSVDSRSPSRSLSRPPTRRRRRYGSLSRSGSPPSRRNGRHENGSRSRSRGRDRSLSPLAGGTKIVVERLTKNVNEDHLYEIFGQFGQIKDLDLPISRQSGTNRGTAYILFQHGDDAESAIAHLHEAQVDGATINVSIVLPRKNVSPAPPVAQRGANIDPRIPFGAPRGGPGVMGGPGRTRPSPSNRFGPGSDVYRPGSRSPRSRSPAGGPTSRGTGSRYRSRSAYSSSRSRSPPPKRRDRQGNDGRRRTRSSSRSRSYDGHDNRSRSRSLSRNRDHHR
ncbi:hypothetical protein N3K66_000748 [Trichothecium roseum]|uniref:Uncharacterized protein n=1 Tax=Trichothecium roseum TaxID=47278 RepID=A0ACC0VD42_9HYPO|nr:hypothetical protein N3K66_000748 [Trichothecium roseum]